jgi:hypothetical protein
MTLYSGDSSDPVYILEVAVELCKDYCGQILFVFQDNNPQFQKQTHLKLDCIFQCNVVCRVLVVGLLSCKVVCQWFVSGLSVVCQWFVGLCMAVAKQTLRDSLLVNVVFVCLRCIPAILAPPQPSLIACSRTHTFNSRHDFCSTCVPATKASEATPAGMHLFCKYAWAHPS